MNLQNQGDFSRRTEYKLIVNLENYIGGFLHFCYIETSSQ